MASPVVVIIGAGPNIGLHSARAFAAKAYKVALSSRKETEEIEGFSHFTVDLSDPASVSGLFKKVKQALGVPTVVIYNAKISLNDGKDPLSSIELDGFSRDFNITTTSAVMSAKEAVASFSKSNFDGPQTFIYTGNILNIVPMPALLAFGMQKTAGAHRIRAASMAYAEKEHKFYYVDQRKHDGTNAGMEELSGDAHAKLFVELAEDKKQREWLQTFVKGVGYVDFSSY